MVHFATKNRQLLVAAANTYVASLKKPLSWDDVKTDMTTAEKFFKSLVSLKEVFKPISIVTADQLKAYIMNAAELFGGHTCPLHTCLCQDVADKSHSHPTS